MTTYIIKTVLCSALLLLFYFLFLEREKMHRFKRFYLLASMVLSFTIPFITISSPADIVPFQQTIDLPALQPSIPEKTQPAIISHSNYLSLCIQLFYAAIALLLLLVLIKNMLTIYSRVKHNRSVDHGNATLILLDTKLTPHSFLHFIFLDKESYENAGIEKEIISHELAHVQQKHSLDILFIELLLVFSWFNPFLYLYRRAIQLNHEFLADDAVIKTFNDTSSYQYLLLQRAAQPGGISFTSRFNYLITKKRLVMMTKNTSAKVAFLKQLALLPLLTVTCLLFCSRSFTQTTTEKPPVVTNKIIAYGTGASQELLDEYDASLKKMTVEKTLKNGKKVQVTDMSKGDVDRLGYIFSQMNKEQRDERINNTHVQIVPNTAPAKRSPDAAQLQNWKNAAKYGVWIDGKRIANNELSKYNPADFSLYWESKLSKNAINYGKHYYQVDLYTTEGYNNSYMKNSSKFSFWYTK